MQMKISYVQAETYAFFFENVHLLLVAWERDGKKELYHIVSQEGEEISLAYPGDRFVEQVMQVIENIFFVHVREGEREGQYILGVYFLHGDQPYGVYYERTRENRPECIFLRIVEKGSSYGLENVEDEREYQQVVQSFMREYADIFPLSFA